MCLALVPVTRRVGIPAGTSESVDRVGLVLTMPSPYDNLSAKQCHQKSLPCSVNNTAVCITQEEANQIYRLGNYEYAYR
jgi:hypothetical protein